MTAAVLCPSALEAQVPAISGATPDGVIERFAQAAGGQAAIDRIQSRQITAKRGHTKVVYFWQKPNKVLLVEGKKKTGYDGGSGWQLSTKKKVTRLPKGSQTALEMDADPLRYVHLKQLYSELQAAPPVSLDGRAMDVVTAPNDRGATKFFFDRGTHLLARIEETGETSAYFKQTTDFDDYQEIDGIKLPFRIIHQSTEPGGGSQELRVSKIEQNVPLKAEIFSKPASVNAVYGGKR